MIKIIKADEYRHMPWKNGRGTTCEVMRQPTFDDEPLDWRVSIADIKDQVSSFSLFPGLTRVISTLEGDGMKLCVDGQWSRELLAFDPFVFSGDSIVESSLIGGPIRDFNLIYNPLILHARLQWLKVCGPQVFCSSAAQVLIFSVGQMNAQTGGQSWALDQHDSLLSHNESGHLARFEIHGRPKGDNNYCCLIEIDPK